MKENKELSCIDDLVSIIMPAYNCESFIADSILSVQGQTHLEWELIIVDDCSTDRTRDFIQEYAKCDSRIHLYRNKENQGAAYSRNKAVKHARGEFIAFLDSDDLWMKEKLETQIRFIKEKKCSFTCTYYKKIDEEGKETGELVRGKAEQNYKDLLKNCPGNSTIIYNAKVLGKFYIPNIKKRNDYVMWLRVIKKAGTLYTVNQALGYHRIRSGSLSKKKFDLIRYHWIVYRKIERLNFFFSIYLLVYWCLKGVWKKWIRNN